MAWADYYQSLINKLVQLVGGDGGAGHVNVQRELPILRASDLVAIMTQFSPALVHAVQAQNFAGGQRIAIAAAGDLDKNRVPSSSLVDTDGSFIGDVDDAFAINKGDRSISCAQYVAGFGSSVGAPWRRTLSPPADDDLSAWSGVVTYEPCSNLTSDTSGGSGGLSFVRQAMVDWQACVNYAAQVIANGDATRKLDGGTVEAFYQLLGKLADDLDVLEENPPATPDIGEAFAYAKDKTEKAVVAIAKKGGEAAAELGNLAGQVAGSFGSGFFSQATFLTLAVAGVAVFVLLR